jgi:hypothetical protein
LKMLCVCRLLPLTICLVTRSYKQGLVKGITIFIIFPISCFLGLTV